MAKSLVSVPKKKEREDFISSMIKGEMVRYHKSPEQIAVKAQFSTKTLTTKLGEPGRFTIEELYVNCIECGTPVAVKWNSREKLYDTIREED